MAQIPRNSNLYVGYTSVGGFRAIYDQNTVKQGLLNQFNTRKGDKLMDANFGFIGWNLIFDLMTPINRSILEEDARRIVNSDPRVEMQSFNLRDIDHGYVIEITLLYKIIGVTDTLLLEFEKPS